MLTFDLYDCGPDKAEYVKTVEAPDAETALHNEGYRWIDPEGRAIIEAKPSGFKYNKTRWIEARIVNQG